MNDEIDLARQMRLLADAVPSEAGKKAERHLLEAFRLRRRRRKQLWIYAAAAALAGIALAEGLRMFERPVVRDQVYDAPGFIALPYSESGVPMESVVVIRVQMRPAELASIGVAVPAEPSNITLKADLLVGQDGVPRAVRFVE